MPRWSRARTRSAAGAKRQLRRADPIVLVVESFNRSDGRRLWEYRVEARGPFPDLHEKHNLATPTPVTDGERALRLVRHRSARGARHARRRRVVEAPRRRVLAVRHQLGTRQLSGALQGSADPAVRSPVGVVPGRARRAHRKAALEGRPRKGARLVQHAARRSRPERRRARRQLERAHRRRTIRPPASCCGTRTLRVRRRSHRRSFTTA